MFMTLSQNMNNSSVAAAALYPWLDKMLKYYYDITLEISPKIQEPLVEQAKLEKVEGKIRALDEKNAGRDYFCRW